MCERLDPELLNHLMTEFGCHGERAVEFLNTASHLLAFGSGSVAPRLAETIVYCLREAMAEIPKSQDQQGESWRSISRDVVRAKEHYERSRGVPGMDEQGALQEILERIQSMSAFHEELSVREKQLITVQLRRTGSSHAAADVVRHYNRLVSKLSRRLHSSVSVDEPERLLADCLAILRTLFLPPQVRYEQLELLAQHDPPSKDDLTAVRQLVTTPAHIRYFLEHIHSTSWLDPLTDTGLLDPPAIGELWSVFGPAERYADTEPQVVVNWLRKLYMRNSNNASRAVGIGRVALDIGEPGLSLVLEIVKRHEREEGAVHVAWRAAMGAKAEEQVLESFADVVFDHEYGSLGPNLGDVGAKLVTGMNRDNAKRRISFLCNKIRACKESRRRFPLQRSIADPPKRRRDGRFEVLREALIAGACRAREWMDTKSVVELLSRLPDGIRIRVRSWLLGSGMDVQGSDLLAELGSAITQRHPNGDDLRLVDRITAEIDPSRCSKMLDEALGAPPTSEDVRGALAAGKLPEEVARAYQWSAIVPSVRFGKWGDALSALYDVRGIPSRALFIRRDTEPLVRRAESPFSVERLSEVSREEACQMIAEWRPSETEWMVMARELGRIVEQLVADDPREWLSSPLVTAKLLGHPTYIHHYLLAASRVLTTVDPVCEFVDLLAWVRSDPWEPVALGRSDFGYDQDWKGTRHASINVIEVLADGDAGFADRDDDVWAILEAAVADRTDGSVIEAEGDEHDPIDQAINRPCTRALEAALRFMAFEYRKHGAVRTEGLSLLERSVQLRGSDGLQHRAIIALYIGFLLHIAPDWMDDWGDELFKTEEDDLGQRTLDQFLKWSRPDRWVAERYRTGVQDAVRRHVENGLDHFLTAMFSNWCGYSVHRGEDLLTSDPKLLSAAGASMSQLFLDGDVIPSRVEDVIQLWRLALDNNRDKDVLTGFGWLARVEALDDNRWSELTQATLEHTGGAIAMPHVVAERAARLAGTAGAVRIMNYLVRGVQGWDSFEIQQHAADLLKNSAELIEDSDYKKLHTALLERSGQI